MIEEWVELFKALFFHFIQSMSGHSWFSKRRKKTNKLNPHSSISVKIRLMSHFTVVTYLKVATLVMTDSRPVSWLSYKKIYVTLVCYRLLKCIHSVSII